MGLHPQPKFSLNEEELKKIMDIRGIRMRDFDQDSTFGYTAKSIYRARNHGYMTVELGHALSNYLQVPIEKFTLQK